ncbi:hypothetical protein COU57_00055 [Candidatus Pacearchaeota archaeon CG10_big_fil_rev_8_21_14_0_10_32_14]|nr:MAG: hypothetical protein COU57_00055 [Candidatus Pacearchaeota archaeon CG10_big_fil_rev_8_21_14_0_10_32_14]
MNLKKLLPQTNSLLKFVSSSDPSLPLYDKQIIQKAINYILFVEEIVESDSRYPFSHLPYPELIPGSHGSIDVLWTGRFGDERNPYRLLLNVSPEDKTSSLWLLTLDKKFKPHNIYRDERLFKVSI